MSMGHCWTHDHRVRDPVRDALHELVANQTQVILATARGPQALAAVLRPLRLSPLVVCFSGAWVGEIDYLSLRRKRAVLDRRHRPAVARTIVASALELKVEPNVFTLNTWRARQMTPEIRLESQITECTPLLTDNLLEENNDPSKILLITGEDDSSEPLHVIAEAMQSLSNATFSKANYLEIIPFGTNKAEALGQLIATLGLDLSQLAAIGDGLNDLEMLREAGLGIAMGNAPAAVQSVADWVTSTNDQAGVAQAVRRLFQEDFI